MKRSRMLVLVSGLTVLSLGWAVAPAVAKPLERVHFHDSSSEVIDAFCGDLTVREDIHVDGKFLLNPHGPDGLAYGSENVHATASWTNLANNKSFTAVSNVNQKDLKVTDNGERHPSPFSSWPPVPVRSTGQTANSCSTTLGRSGSNC